jgi:16S rRNA (cytidine1402-2'-O)-methyltransferase
MKTLHLIPNTLGTRTPALELSATALAALARCNRFIVESEKSARRLLKDACPDRSQLDLQFFLLNEHTDHQDLLDLLRWFRSDEDLGLISDAGCPGVADPGAQAVLIAHNQDWSVVPHVGPSSILLALMASGLNGQSFAFKGYLPRDGKRREHAWKDLRSTLNAGQETQIFMEPPYRNNQTFKEIIATLPETIRLCIAVDLTLPTQWVKTLELVDWKKAEAPDLHKRPCLFLLGS